MNQEKKGSKINLVIIGCCRSGTKFISNHLRLGHEKKGENGIACWHAVVDDNPYYTIQPTDFVLHQVRHPVDVISSCHAILLEESWNLILTNIKQIQREDSLLLKCMKLWYYWNKMAEKRALATYRVEAVSSDVPKDTHSRKDLDIYKKISWADMENEDKELTNKIRELARRYSYEL